MLIKFMIITRDKIHVYVHTVAIASGKFRTLKLVLLLVVTLKEQENTTYYQELKS